MKYLHRVADEMPQERLETFGAVLIEGPKWTGRTTTAAAKPSFLLKSDKPRLIDEWQDALAIWDAVRTAVDNANGVSGQLRLGWFFLKSQKRSPTDKPRERYLRLRFCVRRNIRGKVPSFNALTLWQIASTEVFSIIKLLTHLLTQSVC